LLEVGVLDRRSAARRTALALHLAHHGATGQQGQPIKLLEKSCIE
jgi:hypothetical protein